MMVNRADDRIGVSNKIGVKNAEVGFGFGGDVIFFQMKKPGGGKFGILHGFRSILLNLGIDPVPDGIKNADMGRDGFNWVS